MIQHNIYDISFLSRKEETWRISEEDIRIFSFLLVCFLFGRSPADAGDPLQIIRRVHMKKTWIAAMAAAAAVSAVPAAVFAAEADSADLMLRIYLANQPEALRENYSSLEIKEDDDLTCYCYEDGWIEVNSDHYEGVRLYTEACDYIVLPDGRFQRIIGLGVEPDHWDLLPEEFLREEILSVEESGDELVVTARIPGELAEDSWYEDYADVENADQIEFRTVYVVDAETYELHRRTDVDVMPDEEKTEVTVSDTTVRFDTENPWQEEADALDAHLAGETEMRTVTCILDEGTPAERTYIYLAQKGDLCGLTNLTDHGVDYLIDRDRSVLSNSELDNDLTIYLVPEEGEETGEDAEAAEEDAAEDEEETDSAEDDGEETDSAEGEEAASAESEEEEHGTDQTE